MGVRRGSHRICQKVPNLGGTSFANCSRLVIATLPASLCATYRSNVLPAGIAVWRLAPLGHLRPSVVGYGSRLHFPISVFPPALRLFRHRTAARPASPAFSRFVMRLTTFPNGDPVRNQSY